MGVMHHAVMGWRSSTRVEMGVGERQAAAGHLNWLGSGKITVVRLEPEGFILSGMNVGHVVGG